MVKVTILTIIDGVMTMQIMTAKDAKTRFGELVDTMQREPVLVTKNDRPVGVFVSLEDLKGTYLADLLAPQESGYDEWAKNQVGEALASVKANPAQGKSKEEVHARVMEKVRQKLHGIK